MSPHILVVDDDPNVRELESVRLPRIGYEVTTCKSADAALKLLEGASATFQLVLTDFKMPRMNGVEFAKTLRNRGHGVPVALMSGYRSELTEADALRTGIADVLSKPISTDDLRAAIEELLCPIPVE